MVSVVLVTYNGSSVVEEALRSLKELRWPNLEIIIVDNASSDDTIEKTSRYFPNARTLVLAENRGYGAGGNAGARVAKGEILFFVNQDIALDNDFVDGIVTAMSRDTNIGVCGGTVLSWDGTTLISLGQVFERWTGYGFDVGFGTHDLNLKRTTNEVFSPNGAAFAVKRQVFEEVGGFNEELFMYFDETDLSWRAQIAGYRVASSPTSIVRHMITPDRAYNPRSRYFIDRNTLWSAARNYQPASLLVFLPTSLATRLGMILLFAILGRHEHARSAFRAVTDFIASLPKLFKERGSHAQIRRLSDSQVMRKEVLARPHDIVRLFSGSLLPHTTTRHQ